MILLRWFLALLVAGLTGASALAADPITVTDVAGRTVTLPGPAKKVVLAQARHFPVLGMLHPDPASIVAGWSEEFRTAYVNEYEDYLARFPQVAEIPVISRHTADTFSVEAALGLRPDLVILTARFAGLRPGMDPSQSPLIRDFEAAGVPVIVIDFFLDPLNNTVPSLRALGQAIGQPERAEELIAFYEERMQRIADRVGENRPPVLVHAHAGSTDCCNSPGVGTFNDMITFAGGHNIGADVLRGPTGMLDLEYIIRSNPVLYVATGAGGAQQRGLSIGSGIDEDKARASLAEIVRRDRLVALPAVQKGQAHGVWHAFNDSPLHVMFIEALARWIDPERFADVSPDETLAIFNERFNTVPLRGTFLVDLKPAAAGER